MLTAILFYGYNFDLKTLLKNSTKQRLASGNDPVDSFVLSAEAALAGAESTKHMQAQVIICLSTSYKIVIFLCCGFFLFIKIYVELMIWSYVRV